MDELDLPHSPRALSARLVRLHQDRKSHHRSTPFRQRLSLKPQERGIVLSKTDGRCHLCGGEIAEGKFAADHVLAHAVGGPHELDNYLAAHRVCNGCRWFYSPEE